MCADKKNPRRSGRGFPCQVLSVDGSGGRLLALVRGPETLVRQVEQRGQDDEEDNDAPPPHVIDTYMSQLAVLPGGWFGQL